MKKNEVITKCRHCDKNDSDGGHFRIGVKYSDGDGFHKFEPLSEAITNKRETRDEARQRIGIALQTEIAEMRKTGLTDMVLGLKVYAALVDARYELEQLKIQLGLEIKDIAIYNPNSKGIAPWNRDA